jgi:hypothetical protein
MRLCSPKGEILGGKAFSKAGLLLLSLILLALGRPAPGLARDVAIRSITVTVAAPVFLSLQVGSPGAIIDLVTFRVGGIPGSGAVRGESTGTYPVPFRAWGLLTSAGMVTLAADSSQPLSDGMGHTIPFSQISWQGSGAVPSGRFTGTSKQTVWQQATSGWFRAEGAMAFFYDNILFVPSGTYLGRVTYTLSVP